MPQRKIDSPSSEGAHQVASLLARIDRLLEQIAAREERIDELLARVKALTARIAELEAKLGEPPKTPDNAALPPSRGQKANIKAVGDQAAAQGPTRRHAQAGREARRDATRAPLSGCASGPRSQGERKIKRRLGL